MKKIITAVIILLFARLPGAASGSGGGTSFKFLQTPPSARAAALGGAGTADSYEISGFWYNPAVLAERDSYELSFMYNSYFEGVSQQDFSAGLKNNLGFSVNYVNLGDFDRTTLTNPSGNDLNDYGGSDIAVTAGYGRRFGKISAGMSVKYIREEIDGTYAQTACLDGGVLYDIPGALKYAGGTAVGLSVRNIGEKAEFVTEEEALPAELRMGLKRKVKAADILTVAVLADTVKTFGESWDFYAGLEAELYRVLTLQGGWNTRNQAGGGITAGAGYNFGRFGFNYAFVPFGELGNTHRGSFRVKF